MITPPTLQPLTSPRPAAGSRSHRHRFRTTAAAVLHLPPHSRPPADGKIFDVPCWKAAADVYDVGGAAPSAIGTVTVYTTNFAAVDAKVETACRILKKNERARGARVLTCGAATVAMMPGPTASSECVGMFFLDATAAPPLLRRIDA